MSKTPLFSRVRFLFQRAMIAKRLGLDDRAPADREKIDAAHRALVEQGARDRATWRANRRRFLEAMGATGAVVGLAGTAGCGPAPDGDAGPDEDRRVLVIGGGIAGLHCAYRLHAAGVDVTLFDSADRVGGRMYTAGGLFLDDQLCELGGELIDTNHATLWALAEEFDIALDDRFSFIEAGQRAELAYVNGAVVDEATLVTQMGAVADVMATTLDAAENDDTAFETTDNISLQQWLDDNVPPATYPELHAVLATAYRGEYGLEIDEQSCLNLLYLIDFEVTDPFHIFGDSDERWHTHLGNEEFPKKLAAGIDVDRIHTSHALTKLADKEGGGFVATFTDGAGAEVTFEAEHVVLALPFTRLREVDLTELTLSDDKREIIENIGYGTNAKVMVGFSSRFWNTAGDTGSLTTDLSVQQTWDTSVGQDGASGILTNFLGGDQGLAAGNGTKEAWATGVVLPDLEAVWPGITAAATGTVERMHWPTHAHTKGSYTCYRPGQWAYWSLEGAREGNVHFCGEHCSLDFQGWMEGAAETGGLAAKEILDDAGIALSSAHMAAIESALASAEAARVGGGGTSFLRRRRAVRRAIRAAIEG